MHLLLLSLFILQTSSTSHLRYVQVVFSNGERMTSRMTYPTDPYASQVGNGELTKTGIEQMRQLGRYLRERYAEILGEDVKAFSADSSECTESMELLLKEVTGKRVDVEALKDPISCGRFTREVGKIRTLPDVENRLYKYNGFFRYITKKTGLSLYKNPDEVIYQLYKTLEAQAAQKLNTPEWCTKRVQDFLEDVVSLNHDIETYSPTLTRVTTGFFLKSFLKPTAKGLHLQVGDDRIIAALLRVLGRRNFDDPLSKPSSAVIFEKWSYGDGDYVRVIAKTENYNFTLPIKKCPEWCSIQRFEKEVMRAFENYNSCV